MPNRHLPAVVKGSSVSTERIFATATRVLRAVGVEPGQTCLDFGCGHGNYTVPLARLAGPTGKVFAVDKDKRVLNKLARRARAAGLANIKRMPSTGELTLPLEDGSVDVILLYAVLHAHYFSAGQRASLLEEVARVGKPGALLSVFPNHMTDNEVDREVVARAGALGFESASEYEGTLVHDDGVTEGRILTFRKVDA